MAIALWPTFDRSTPRLREVVGHWGWLTPHGDIVCLVYASASRIRLASLRIQSLTWQAVVLGGREPKIL
ncbi:MAG: hypothetical protein ABSF35_18530 [Polyangia bacterium]